MVWNVDHKCIHKPGQRYEEMPPPFHPILNRKVSTVSGVGISETDGGIISRRRDVIIKGMFKDIKDVTKIVHETATSTMSFFEHVGLTMSPTSMSSSSIDVGPSPGSGLQTEVDSTEMESNQSDDGLDIDEEEEECETLKGIESRPILDDEQTHLETPNFRLGDESRLQQPLSVVEMGKDVIDEMGNNGSKIPSPKSSTGFALATNSSSSSVGSDGPPSVMEPKEDFTQHLN